MHPDRKIGIAMGILLVGVVGALFFRNEPVEQEESLTARRERELNERLRDRDVALYTEPEDPVRFENTNDPHLKLEEILKQNGEVSGHTPVPVRRGEDQTPPRVATDDRDESPLIFGPPPAFVTEPDDAADDRPIADSDDETLKKEAGSGSLSGRRYDEYTVQPGDTLSEIAEKLLGSQTRYRDIYEANHDRMASPDHLRVGSAIRIPRAIH